MLLDRTTFREMVFKRDNGNCVFCSKLAKDAHHILERRLWPDGGYYLDNGASVCEEHHLKCESTEISVEEVRAACNITKPVIPPHLYDDMQYDKWGNPILPNGTRLRGELFEDESVQKVLKPYLNLFTHYVKYPRTYHLPWSPGMNNDDRRMESISSFINKEVIVMEKLDGENTTMYKDYIHARSLDSLNHPSRNWIKQFWNTISYEIPEGWRINAENMYAKHSISYTNLESYCYGFAIWNNKNICLDWDQTLEWFQLLNIPHPKILYKGTFHENTIRGIIINEKECEGYVLRLADSFAYKDFKTSVGKYVRKNHIQTVKHWMHGQPIERNLLQ